MAAGTASRRTSRGPRQQRVLEAIGVQIWVPRAGAAPIPEAAPVPEPVPVPVPVTATNSQAAWTELRAEVAACTRCALHRTRTQTVFGTGSPQARWLVIGEAPGADEDRQGEPFVGRAGQLLTEMLRAVGVDRQQVFIANVLKCRPPENRDPSPEEAKSCEDYLQRQIALIQPRLILVVGRIAAQNLLQVDTPIGRLRGECTPGGRVASRWW
jgi:DNA polymerase